MYKWKWNWCVDNEVYVWRARKGYITALSAASHACVDCPNELMKNQWTNDEQSLQQAPLVRTKDLPWGTETGHQLDGSMLNSRSDTLGNDRKKCNRYGSCSSAGDDHGPYAMVKSLPQQLQCMHASTVLISLLLHEGDQKTVIVETMCSMGLADDKSWQIWTKSLQSYELGRIHAWVRHRPIVCSAMIATDCKRRSAAVSWSQHWTAANWYDLKGWSCDLKQDTGDLEQYQYWRSCDRSNNGRTLKVYDRSKN